MRAPTDTDFYLCPGNPVDHPLKWPLGDLKRSCLYFGAKYRRAGLLEYGWFKSGYHKVKTIGQLFKGLFGTMFLSLYRAKGLQFGDYLVVVFGRHME